MEDMVKAAIEKNISEIAITDHFDPDYPDNTMPFGLDFPSYHEEMERVSNLYKDKIKIIKGIEIGIQGGETTKKCCDAVSAYPYDFVLGSFHSAHGATLDQRVYHRNRNNRQATEDYYNYVYETIRVFDDFDVLGHLNVIDRYVDEIQDEKYYMDYVEAILKLLVEKGKGLEINTSSFRYGLGDRTTPPLNFLKLYVELGGEIITAGSDAHYPKDVGFKLDYAEHMILESGLKYVATFDQRKPIPRRIKE
jgi:histidinol-phosphatase (PHP family)